LSSTVIVSAIIGDFYGIIRHKIVCFGSFSETKNRDTAEVEVGVIPAVMAGLFLL
jgi:hypothetical protein